MTISVNVHVAKTQLSRLIADVEKGADVVIARRGVPVARLVRYEHRQRAPWGSVSLTEPLDDSAFDPMTDDELRHWGVL